MKSKWTLFAGIILLIVGVILRKVTSLGFEPILLILIGVLLKTYYIIGKTKSGTYKHGYELIFLFVGLSLFLSGIYLRSIQSTFNFT